MIGGKASQLRAARAARAATSAVTLADAVVVAGHDADVASEAIAATAPRVRKMKVA